MNVLYKGHYYRRFDRVTKLIAGNKITELCFGDTLIAAYCKQNNKEWVGIDINEQFVRNAKEKGFDARIGNINSLEKIPEADTLIICGSLYHFCIELEILFGKLFQSAGRIIISEPVINLSSAKGIIGKLAKTSAAINGTEHRFRYTKETLCGALDELSKKMEFTYTIVEQFNKDLIIIINK